MTALTALNMVPDAAEGVEGQELVAVRRHVERRPRVAHCYPHRLAGVHVHALGYCVARRRLKV